MWGEAGRIVRNVPLKLHFFLEKETFYYKNVVLCLKVTSDNFVADKYITWCVRKSTL